ncbi:hypothetical protein TRIUR3_15279 [Triticum urartu]|uniref:Uncharacterized protein n=1 Tax=Triticum urartu TaxID=4572 RepID=M7YQ59_TRIUA|nr:hypothetical protein TRIUR3_15279 [Triticum urartu]
MAPNGATALRSVAMEVGLEEVVMAEVPCVCYNSRRRIWPEHLDLWRATSYPEATSDGRATVLDLGGQRASGVGRWATRHIQHGGDGDGLVSGRRRLQQLDRPRTAVLDELRLVDFTDVIVAILLGGVDRCRRFGVLEPSGRSREMGVLFSCPVEDDGECGGLVAAAEEEQQATFLKASLGSGKLRIEGSLSFKRLQLVEPKIPIAVTAPVPVPVPMPRELLRTRFADAAVTAAAQPESPKHEAAAVTLQKVYKSFRTRRRLADCAVLVEQNWWELLDFALLKRSSVSFFDIERQETAVSKWARARTRAAKVGKGLSKDEKARKLALQHWLEAVSTFVRETAECSVNFRVFAKQCAHVTAEFSDEQIDPRHRYGHNLHYYYDCWLRLDIGEGKEINLEDRCPRSKLLSQCIKYLGPKEREEYEVVIEDGKFMYKNSRQILDSSGGPRDAKWIFVLSTSRNLYVGQDFLRENKVDLSDVKMSPTEEDEEFWSRLRSIPSERCTDADKPEEEMVPAAETIPCQAPQGLPAGAAAPGAGGGAPVAEEERQADVEVLVAAEGRQPDVERLEVERNRRTKPFRHLAREETAKAKTAWHTKERTCAICRLCGYVSSTLDTGTTSKDNDYDDPPAADACTNEYYHRSNDCKGEGPTKKWRSPPPRPL